VRGKKVRSEKVRSEKQKIPLNSFRCDVGREKGDLKKVMEDNREKYYD
jgi:hypothetical protein